MKKYIWAFPGMGKSHINNERIADVDCEQFKYVFPDGVPGELHKSGVWEGVLQNPEYPENYFRHIESLDADTVLLNCHISLLERFDKDSVLVVYPCEDLIVEYLERYKARGDNQSFVSYMAEEAEGMVRHIDSLDFKKYKVFKRNTYLSDLFERNDFKVKVMTRNELTEQLQRAIDLKVIDVDSVPGTIVCDVKFAEEGALDRRLESVPGPESVASVWANGVLEGNWSLDIDQLFKACSLREAEIEQEKIMSERRGGLSREELEDKIMQGIVNGALSISHGQIAPYSYGYEVEFFGGGAGDAGRNRWECYCDLFEVPKTIAQKIEQGSQNKKTFSNAEPAPFNVKAFLSRIEHAETTKITSFTPEKDSTLQRAKNSYTYPFRNTIANLGDVHKGNGLDGIATGAFGGDYSSLTTNSQNVLVQTVVFLKGFCLDFLEGSHIYKDDIVDYLKRHGTDISTPEKLQEWIKSNPEKCGKKENRVVKQQLNEGHELYAQAYCNFIELKAIIEKHTGSLKELCDKLNGRDYDGFFFDVSFGSLDATISCKEGKIEINDRHIGIWNASKTAWVEENVSLEYLKDTCEEIGYSIAALEAKALDKSKDGVLSLDEQISKCEAQKEAADPISQALERGEFR